MPITVPGLYDPGVYYFYLVCDPLNALQEPFRKAGFGEQAFHGQTTLHPLGALAILVLGIAVLSTKETS